MNIFHVLSNLRTRCISSSLKAFTLFLTLCMISFNTQASNNSRAEKWQFYLAPQFTNSKLLQFENGAEADINEHSTWAFGIGYNVNEHIELNLAFSAGNSNYSGTRIIDNTPEDPDNPNGPQKFTANLYTSSIKFDFTYNLLKSDFTPFIGANIGSTFIDSGVPTGNIVTGCWWDPWWGYVCFPTAQTYTSTEFTYGASLGVRYDFTGKLFIKAGASKNYLDINSSNSADFTTYQLAFGLMF